MASKVSLSGRYHLHRDFNADYEADKDTQSSSSLERQVRLAWSHGMKYTLSVVQIRGAFEEQLEDFRSECEILLLIDHPHVQRLTDVYKTRDQLVFVLEHLEGGDLYQRALERKVFTERDAAISTWQMLLALNYLHANSVVHRNLTMDAFVFEKKDSDHLKLTDFGVSKVLSSNRPKADFRKLQFTKKQFKEQFQGCLKYLDDVPIKWVTVRFLRQLADSGQSLPRYQDVPEKAFVLGSAGIPPNESAVDKGRWVVSHPWLAHEHPDPQGAQLKALVAELAILKAKDEEAVFYDFVSLPQHDKTHPNIMCIMKEQGQLPAPGDHPAVRTPEEEGQFKRALLQMQLLYSFGGFKVIVIPDMYAVIDPCFNVNLTPYVMRGWCFFELALSCAFQNISNAEVNQEVELLVEKIMDKQAYTSEGFKREFQSTKFTCKGDRDTVSSLFDSVLANKFDQDSVSSTTMAYNAPEVLHGTYTTQCDQWSLGVILFVLLSGDLPFEGCSDSDTASLICSGRYSVQLARWDRVSSLAFDFVRKLLVVNPATRLTAEQAIQHPWMATREASSGSVDASIVDGLVQFSQASKAQRCCMQVMALSLSREERAQLRDTFLLLDTDCKGTIRLSELALLLEKDFNMPHGQATSICSSLDHYHNKEISYMDFLAAMIQTRINAHDDLIYGTFRRFDVDDSGFITVEGLRELLGGSFEGQVLDNIIKEIDMTGSGKISYQAFLAFIKSDNPAIQDAAVEIADQIIDTELKKCGP